MKTGSGGGGVGNTKKAQLPPSPGEKPPLKRFLVFRASEGMSETTRPVSDGPRAGAGATGRGSFIPVVGCDEDLNNSARCCHLETSGEVCFSVRCGSRSQTAVS